MCNFLPEGSSNIIRKKKQMEPKRFYRSLTERVFAGVCGGLSEYFLLDVLLIRLVFVILAVAGGGGVLLYMILWIVTPERPANFSYSQNPSAMEDQKNPQSEPPRSPENPAPGTPPGQGYPEHKFRGNLIGGLVLITLGALFLADQFIPHIRFFDLWPVILIIVGIGLLINSVSGKRKKY
jgi:phage shock protein C